MTRGCCRQEPAPTFDAQPPTEEKIEAIRCNQPTLPRFQVDTRGLTRSVVFAGTERQTAAKEAWPWPPFDEIYEVPITADTVGPDEHEPRPPLTPRKLAPIPPWCVSFQTAVFTRAAALSCTAAQELTRVQRTCVRAPYAPPFNSLPPDGIDYADALSFVQAQEEVRASHHTISVLLRVALA